MIASCYILPQNVDMQVDTAKSLAASLEQASLPEFPYFNTLLRILTTRCMLQAVYFCSGTLQEEEYLHYGLATPIYTHFTSPIRRSVGQHAGHYQTTFSYCSWLNLVEICG